MSAPFLDPSLIVTALAGLIESETVAEISTVTDMERAKDRRGRQASPALFVVPHESSVSGPPGVGNGRELAETVGIVIQLKDASAGCGGAPASITAIRAAIFDALEGLRLGPQWAHLRYLGGNLLDLGDDPGTVYRWVDVYQTESPVTVRPRDLTP